MCSYRRRPRAAYPCWMRPTALCRRRYSKAMPGPIATRCSSRSTTCHRWVSSRPVGFHHQPLTKPCLRLSPHTAFHSDHAAHSHRQPLSGESGGSSWLPSCPKCPPRLAMSAPWLHAHYRRFNATTGRSAIFKCIGILHFGDPLIDFPLASPEDFPSPLSKPELASSRLYTGHRMDRKQISSILISENSGVSGFDVTLTLTMRHQRFTCVLL